MRLLPVRMALVGLVCLACGGNQPDSSGGSPESPEDIIVIVDNDFGSTIVAFAVFGAAAARRMGNVSAGEERHFTLPWSGAGFATQIQSVLNNRRITSNTTNLPPGAIVHVEINSSFRVTVQAFAVN